jgi:hypothetical protein
MLIVMTCSWAYVTFGSLPPVQSVLYGVKPVIIAVVLQALWELGRTAIKSGFLLAVGLLAAVAAIAGGNAGVKDRPTPPETEHKARHMCAKGFVHTAKPVPTDALRVWVPSNSFRDPKTFSIHGVSLPH